MLNNEDLGIPYWTYEGLVRVRDMLRSGVIKEALDVIPWKNGIPAGLNFNMNYSARRGYCGSVCCIGGWVYALTYGEESKDKDGNSVYVYDEIAANDYVLRSEHDGLYPLFYPNKDETRPFDICWSYNRITAQQAAQAIDNYLTTGQPRWGDILGPSNIDGE